MDVWAASLAGDTKAVLAALSADPNVLNALKKGGLFDSRTALHCAASRGHGDVVSALLSHGADRKLIDKRGSTAAQLARKQGFEQIALEIERSDGSHKQDVAAGATVHAEEVRSTEAIVANSCREGAMQAAVQRRGQREAKRTREAPVDRSTDFACSEPSAKRANVATDATRLCRHAVNGNARELFSCLSADPSLINIAQSGGLFDGRTPLQCAAARGHADIVAGLLQHCADPSFVDKRGCTAVMLAQKQGHADVAAMLERHLLQSKATTEEAGAPSESDVSDAMPGIEAVEGCKPDSGTFGFEVRTEGLPTTCFTPDGPSNRGGQTVTERHGSSSVNGALTPEPASAPAPTPAPAPAPAPAPVPVAAATPAPEREPVEQVKQATMTRVQEEDEDSIINRILEEDQSADEEFFD